MTRVISLGILFMVVMSIGALTVGCANLSQQKDVPAVVGMTASVYQGYPYLSVYLNPSNAKAGQLYTIDLYDKSSGMFRERKNITFTQPQVNVGSVQSVAFTLTEQERSTYAWQTNPDWWKSCFIVRINQRIPDQSIRKPTP